MNIIVLAKLVPDLVEELEIDDSGTALDMTWLRLIINELDDHAIEEAILLKERYGAHVTILSPEIEGVDDILFTAAAKGADRLVKVTGEYESGINNHALARVLVEPIKDMSPDLILAGVEANEDLDGSIGPLLAGYLDWPFIGYVAKVTLQDSIAKIHKEYPGGLTAEFDINLPAVLGIQVAEQPPRYVAVSKVRQAMKTAEIEEIYAGQFDLSGGPKIERMYQPEAGEGATMLEGSIDDIADRLIGIFNELGVR
ncbi:MAG: electron transfer flavoprotein subunit beta [Chloroflexota bacterium]|nr:MAG: electron transfer flavoprotein subunit beta [Chloroflexota bacterium]